MDKNLGMGNSKDNTMRNTAIGFTLGMLFGGLIDMLTGDLGVATILGMLMGSILGRYGLRRIHWMEYPSGVLLRVALASVLFFAVLFGTYYLIDLDLANGLEPYLPLLPILPGVLFILSIGYALSTLDELQRRIQVEAIAIGFGITAIITMTVGLLGLTGVRQPNWMLVPFIMTFSWLVGKLWTKWHYR